MRRSEVKTQKSLATLLQVMSRKENKFNDGSTPALSYQECNKVAKRLVSSVRSGMNLSTSDLVIEVKLNKKKMAVEILQHVMRDYGRPYWLSGSKKMMKRVLDHAK